MARFDLHVNTGKGKAHAPFLVNVQSNYLQGLGTRVVVPLMRVDAFPPAKLPADLTPVFHVQGVECMLYPAFIGAVPTSELGGSIGSLRDEQDRILAALDRLTGGF
jgi:toxin CcdB